MTNNRFHFSVILIAGFGLLMATYTIAAHAQTDLPDSEPVNEETTMAVRITGTFDVKLTPQGQTETAEDSPIRRMSLDKQFRGDLDATSQGQMLGVQAVTAGSGGYVALEFVTGSLKERNGTFVLQHSSTMTRGVPNQSIRVVPDSATGELAGLDGEMTIDVVDGSHSFEFAYTLPPLPAE